MMARKLWFSLLIVGLTVAGGSAQQSQKPGQEHPTPPATGATVAQSPHTFNITPEDKTRKNPIRFTDISVARGKELYLSQCAMCHGEKEKEKGTVAIEMKAVPPDFTNPDLLSKRTDGELFAIIGQGGAPMPGQSARLTVRQRWDLVNFLRGAEGKSPAKATAEEREKAQELHTVAAPK
jgi:mono/diheme cytochrome c family protein